MDGPVEERPALAAAQCVGGVDVTVQEQRIRPLLDRQLLGFGLAPRQEAEPVIARQFEQWQLYATTNSSATS